MSQNEKPVKYTVRSVAWEGFVGAGRLIHFPSAKNESVDVPVPSDIPESEPLATLTVSGDSLERVGIFDGDVVLCRKIVSKKQIKPDTVCIVYSPSTGETNAKKISFSGEHLRLKYCGYGDIKDDYVLADEVEIRGIVISATRRRNEWPFVDGDHGDILF